MKQTKVIGLSEEQSQLEKEYKRWNPRDELKTWIGFIEKKKFEKLKNQEKEIEEFEKIRLEAERIEAVREKSPSKYGEKNGLSAALQMMGYMNQQEVEEKVVVVGYYHDDLEKGQVINHSHECQDCGQEFIHQHQIRSRDGQDEYVRYHPQSVKCERCKKLNQDGGQSIPNDFRGHAGRLAARLGRHFGLIKYLIYSRSRMDWNWIDENGGKTKELMKSKSYDLEVTLMQENFNGYKVRISRYDKGTQKSDDDMYIEVFADISAKWIMVGDREIIAHNGDPKNLEVILRKEIGIFEKIQQLQDVEERQYRAINTNEQVVVKCPHFSVLKINPYDEDIEKVSMDWVNLRLNLESDSVNVSEDRPVRVLLMQTFVAAESSEFNRMFHTNPLIDMITYVSKSTHWRPIVDFMWFLRQSLDIDGGGPNKLEIEVDTSLLDFRDMDDHGGLYLMLIMNEYDNDYLYRVSMTGLYCTHEIRDRQPFIGYQADTRIFCEDLNFNYKGEMIRGMSMSPQNPIAVKISYKIDSFVVGSVPPCQILILMSFCDPDGETRVFDDFKCGEVGDNYGDYVQVLGMLEIGRDNSACSNLVLKVPSTRNSVGKLTIMSRFKTCSPIRASGLIYYQWLIDKPGING